MGKKEIFEQKIKPLLIYAIIVPNSIGAVPGFTHPLSKGEIETVKKALGDIGECV